MMQRLKKAFLFILGLMVVPRFLSAVIMQALNREELDLLSGFFAIIYLLIYFSFPVLYRGKIREKIFGILMSKAMDTHLTIIAASLILQAI